MRNIDGNYVTCGASGKICYTQREAGLVINGCKKHYYMGYHKWAKGGHGNSKAIPRRKYFCSECGYYHVTHTALFSADSRDYSWEEPFYRDYERNRKRA